jgi:NAD(P)-dependent dehydrogenase (short-subunit alcohol dehydrogenase family)
VPRLLEGDVAVVTGGGRGIGAALARGLARHGAAVAVLDLDVANAQQAARIITDSGGLALAVAVDVTDAGQVADAVGAVEKDLGQISVLVNNAGVNRAAAVDDPDFPDVLSQTLHTNLNGTVTVTRACLGGLERRQGRVVNVASIRSFRPLPNGAAYATSKAAIVQATRAFAVELAPRGVRVNAVAPGLIATEMTRRTMQDPQRLAAHLDRVPMGRAGEPDDIVGPVVFLASPMSAYVTGVVLPVDGGYLAA